MSKSPSLQTLPFRKNKIIGVFNLIVLKKMVYLSVGVFVAAFLGDKIRAFFHKKKPTKENAQKKHPMILRLWNKYGIIGLGFLGTMSVGAPISIAVGVGLNANLKKLLTWCCIGVVTRCILFTLIGYYGLQLF